MQKMENSNKQISHGQNQQFTMYTTKDDKATLLLALVPISGAHDSSTFWYILYIMPYL